MFETIQELKNRIRFVLKSKSKDLNKNGYNITPDEIFNNLSKEKWSKSKDLHLCDIVDDILNYKIENNRIGDKDDSK